MGRLNIFLFLYYIFLFFLKEIEILILKIVRFFKIVLNNFNFYNFILFKFNRNINPSNNKFFKHYTSENRKIWKENKIKKKNKKILVTSFVHAHPAYPHGNSIIGKYLEEYFNADLIGFCDSHDHLSEIIMRSFGVNLFFYLYERNPLVKLFYFLSALKIICSFKNIYDFLNYKYNKIDLGKIVYDDVIRRSGHPTISDVSFKLCLHFSSALNISDQYKRILNNSKIDGIVQSETQFCPSGIIFQQSLANKIKVYSREGAGKKMSIKKFSSFSERYTPRKQPSKRIFKLIFKNHRRKAAYIGYKTTITRLSGSTKEEDVRDGKWAHHNKKIYSKIDICKKYKWDKKKPIVIIFSHSLIDGNYSQGSRIFKDNLTWLRETLSHIKNQDKFNWLIKPHPMDWYYQFAKTSTEIEYKKIIGNDKHVRICPKDLSSISISKIVRAAVTSHGSVDLEYSCLGIPVVTAGRTPFSYLKINHITKSKKKYFYYLNNIHKLSKPRAIQIDMARVASFIYSILNKTKNDLIPYHLNTRYVDKDKFYKDCTKLIKNYSRSNDRFKKMSFFQFKNNISQTVNLEAFDNLLKNKNKNYDLKKI